MRASLVGAVGTQVDHPDEGVVAQEHRAARPAGARVHGRRLSLSASSCATAGTAARAHRVEEGVADPRPSAAASGVPTCCDGGQRGPGEEGPRGRRVAQVADSSRYGLIASSTALTSGCAATCRIALPRSPVHLDGPHHPVAAHEQRGAAEPGGGIDLRRRRTVVGQDLGHGRFAAGLYREGEPVPDDPATGQRRSGQRVGAGRLAAVAGRPWLAAPPDACGRLVRGRESPA